MTTVFVLTSGSYSDYRVEGVYSSRENAETVRDAGNFDVPDILECDLDEHLDIAKSGRHIFTVRMDRNGDSERVTKENPWSPIPDMYVWNKRLFMTVVAMDVQHAVKIVNERRAELLASGEWEALESVE